MYVLSFTQFVQNEGGWNTDGKGPSIWDEFTHSHPDRIDGGQNADIATNSYEFYMDDIRALKELKVSLSIDAQQYDNVLTQSTYKL